MEIGGVDTTQLYGTANTTEHWKDTSFMQFHTTLHLSLRSNLVLKQGQEP